MSEEQAGPTAQIAQEQTQSQSQFGQLSQMQAEAQSELQHYAGLTALCEGIAQETFGSGPYRRDVDEIVEHFKSYHPRRTLGEH